MEFQQNLASNLNSDLIIITQRPTAVDVGRIKVILPPIICISVVVLISHFQHIQYQCINHIFNISVCARPEGWCIDNANDRGATYAYIDCDGDRVIVKNQFLVDIYINDMVSMLHIVIRNNYQCKCFFTRFLIIHVQTAKVTLVLFNAIMDALTTGLMGVVLEVHKIFYK